VDKNRMIQENDGHQKELEDIINALQRTLNENTRILEEKEDQQQQLQGSICGLSGCLKNRKLRGTKWRPSFMSV
jgi:hypothetical protein